MINASGFELGPVRTKTERRPSRAGPRPAPPPAPERVYLPPIKDGKASPMPGPSLPPSAGASTVDLEALNTALDLELEEAKTRLTEVPDERELPALPPVDTGRDAWLFLAAATIVETIVWGLPWSVGILHQYWSTEMFPGAESTLTLAATLQTGLMYMTAAFLAPVFTAFPQHEKGIQFYGLAVATAALIASAFVTQPWHLLITIGIFYPFAGALYLPCATLIYEWFQLRRGIATGIMFAGTGAGGTVFPFIVSGLLSRFGYKATMISLGVGFGLSCGVALLFIKRRIPLGRVRGRTQAPKVDWATFMKGKSWLGMIIILITGLGNFIPSLWIPTYADKIRATKPNGTALVAIMNAAAVPGNTLTGWLSDRYPMRVVIPCSCCLATMSTLVLWGMGTSDTLLVLFSIVWGMTALSFVGVWSKMITIICKDDPTLPALYFSLFTILKGVGSLSSGPIATALLDVGGVMTGASGAYGKTNYGLLLIYTGVTNFVGGSFALLFPVK